MNNLTKEQLDFLIQLMKTYGECVETGLLPQERELLALLKKERKELD